MVMRVLSSLFILSTAIISYGQASPDLKAVEDSNTQLSQRENASVRLNKVIQARSTYTSQKDLRSAFAFMSSAYRLLNGVDAAKSFPLKEEAYKASKRFNLKDRFFTGVQVGLAVDTYNSVEVISESEWLMKTFPDQPFFKFRYVQCACGGKDSRKRSKEFLSILASLTKQYPENSQYCILDAFLTQFYAHTRAEVKASISKYERCLTLKISAEEKSYVERHLAHAKKSLQYFKK